MTLDVGLIARLFDAAVDTQLWAEPIEQLVQIAGGKTGTVMAANVLDNKGFCGVWGVHSMPHNFNEMYAGYCAAYEATGVDVMKTSKPLQLLTEVDLWPQEPDLYNRPDFIFLKNFINIKHRVAARLSDDPAFFHTIAIQFDEGRGPINKQERTALSRYLPFVAQSVRLSNVYQTLYTKFQAVLAVMDNYQVAVAIVDRLGRVILSNTAGARLLEKNNGIYKDTRGQLRCTDVDTEAALKQSVQRAADAATGQNAEKAVFLHAVSRRSDQQTYFLEVAPLRDTRQEIETSLNAALVKMFSPDDNPTISLDGFRTVYGLTPAEEAVAHLMTQGLTNIEIADTRGTSPETVKSQTKAILSKMGCKTRTELVRKALSAHVPVLDETHN